MNSEVFQRRFEFYNTRPVRRDFQFNNRNNFRRRNVWQNTSRGHGYQEVSKPKKKWFQRRGVPNARSQSAVSSFATVSQYRPFTPKPQSQAAASSFATVRQYRPFTPRFPFNLTITIPNFSSVRSSNVFRFHNSSAKSVQFTSAPAGMFPQPTSCFTENRGFSDNALKSNETGIDEDVEYLYTVQTKGGELVEVVDLSEDSDVPSCSNEFRISDHHQESNISEKGNNRIVLKIPEKETIPRSVKQGRKRKKSSEDIHCDICDSEYEFIRARGEEIFRSRCGHMFCQLCLKGLSPYKCPECNIFLQKLLKVLF